MIDGSATKRKAPLSYVLITPARNEAAFIEATIRCVRSQTDPPLKWVVVSDGSTDGMDDIVQKHAVDCQWIELVRMPERKERHFAGKVHAFNAGYDRVKGLPYRIIANLDADITFAPDHFEFLLGKFAENPRLGVAGTPFVENEKVAYDYTFTDIRHVSGQCQLFRRECFESIGGYLPRKIGGIDLIAVITARMKGWETRTFPERSFVHHRKMGTGMYGNLRTYFKQGHANYILGNHPVWEVFRSVYQMKKQPFVVRGLLDILGFSWAMIKQTKKEVPHDVIAFTRQEQMERLKSFFSKLLSS